MKAATEKTTSGATNASVAEEAALAMDAEKPRGSSITHQYNEHLNYYDIL